jgi:glutamate-ammonia-ligase adenylyltransferase
VKSADETTRTEAILETSQNHRPAQYEKLARISPHFAQLYTTMFAGESSISTPYAETVADLIADESDYGKRLSVLRRKWARSLLSIVVAEINDGLTISESKRFQTKLAEASIETAQIITRDEMRARYGDAGIDLSILALGKLGGRGVDYGSDLDLVLVYPDSIVPHQKTAAELYSRAVEIFVTALSGMTRDGNLYRVDLRLRPYGKNGASANPRPFFVDYFRKTADVWELLAFVKLRGVSGSIASDVEAEVRHIIHSRALETAPDELRSETIRIRNLLEEQKGGRDKQSDIKYGPGGMLDVYFAARYLQLRDNFPDDPDDRSTMFVLERLWENGSLDQSDHEALTAGYVFLSELDHNIRLTTGRSRRVPHALSVLETIADRMNTADPQTLLGELAIHRINIRKAFENVLRK